MIFPRLLSILSLSLILWNPLSGQDNPVNIPGNWPDEIQLSAADSLSSDSIAGELKVPNVFSPNGDVHNPHIEVKTDGNTVYQFSIFTRTGTRIYYSRSPRIFWDGRSNVGMEQREGIYYYVISEDGGSDPYTKTGFIYLYR